MQEQEEKQNQHYVPKNYFKGFSNDETSICTLIARNGIIKPTVSYSTQSSKDNFYGSKAREDEITEFDTKYFNNRIEVLDALVEQGATELSPSQLDILLENTQFQRERTLTSRNTEQGVRDFHKEFFAPQVDDLLNYDSGHSPEATEASNDAMRMIFESFSDPKDTQYIKLMQIEKNKGEVSDLELIILRNRTAYPFIFSDSPVAYTNPALSDYKCSKLGNTNVGLQIFYPLTPEFLAFFYDSEAYQIDQLPGGSVVLDITSDDDVRQINKLQIHEAANSIYFGRAEDSGYVDILWQEEKPRLERKSKTVASVNQLSMDGYVTGRKSYAISESEPTFYPTLSFVTTNDLSNSYLPFRSSHWRKILPEGAEIERLNDLIDRHSHSKS